MQALEETHQSFQKSLEAEHETLMYRMQALEEAHEAQRCEARQLFEDTHSPLDKLILKVASMETIFETACVQMECKLPAIKTMYHTQSIETVHEEFRDVLKNQKERLECRESKSKIGCVQEFIAAVVERILHMEVCIAQHSLGASDNLGDSQSCQVIMEGLFNHRESQRNVTQAIEELKEGLKTANEWQAGIVQSLGRAEEWQVTMNAKFQELRESHEDATHRVYEALKTAVESRIVFDQAIDSCKDMNCIDSPFVNDSDMDIISGVSEYDALEATGRLVAKVEGLAAAVAGLCAADARTSGLHRSEASNELEVGIDENAHCDTKFREVNL